MACSVLKDRADIHHRKHTSVHAFVTAFRQRESDYRNRCLIFKPVDTNNRTQAQFTLLLTALSFEVAFKLVAAWHRNYRKS